MHAALYVCITFIIPHGSWSLSQRDAALRRNKKKKKKKMLQTLAETNAHNTSFFQGVTVPTFYRDAEQSKRFNKSCFVLNKKMANYRRTLITNRRFVYLTGRIGGILACCLPPTTRPSTKTRVHLSSSFFFHQIDISSPSGSPHIWIWGVLSCFFFWPNLKE